MTMTKDDAIKVLSAWKIYIKENYETSCPQVLEDFDNAIDYAIDSIEKVEKVRRYVRFKRKRLESKYGTNMRG